MKKFLLLIPFLALSALGQNAVASATTAATPVNLLSGRYIVDSIQLTANPGANTTFYFYDAASAITNIVRAAYTNVTSYTTNTTNTYISPEGYTNVTIVAGLYTVTTLTLAVTNERPRIYSGVVPAGGTSAKVWQRILALGLTVYTDQDALVEVTYRSNP